MKDLKDMLNESRGDIDKDIEKKAKEIAKKHMPFAGVPITECIDTALEMAEWMKSYMIEKACEWLKDNANEYLDWYDWEKCRVNKDELLYDFKKEMEK